MSAQTERGDHGQLEAVPPPSPEPDTAEPYREPPPRLPTTWEITDSVTHYQRGPHDSMAVFITPGQVSGGKFVCTAPQIRILFSKEAWERFQREVAADGVKSKVAVSSVLPPTG